MTGSDVHWLAVSTLSWYAPGPVVTVVTSVMCEIGANRICVPSRRPAPFAGSSAVGRFTDLVPFKPRVDLLLSGVDPRAEFDPRAGLRLSRTDFDFGVFQAAPPDQQLPGLGHGAILRLGALIRGAEGVRLPTARPRVFARLEAGEVVEAELRCDTVVVDADGRGLSMTHRGILEVVAVSAVVGVLDEGRASVADEAMRSLRGSAASVSAAPSEGDTLVDDEERTHVLDGRESETVAREESVSRPRRRGGP